MIQLDVILLSIGLMLFDQIGREKNAIYHHIQKSLGQGGKYLNIS